MSQDCETKREEAPCLSRTQTVLEDVRQISDEIYQITNAITTGSSDPVNAPPEPNAPKADADICQIQSIAEGVRNTLNDTRAMLIRLRNG